MKSRHAGGLIVIVILFSSSCETSHCTLTCLCSRFASLLLTGGVVRVLKVGE